MEKNRCANQLKAARWLWFQSPLRLAILAVVSWFALQCCCLEAAETNGTTVTNAQPATKLVPLPLKLPAPTLRCNGPLDLPQGPHIESLSDRPRAPFLVPVGVTNVALGRPVTASAKTPVWGTLGMVTDGRKEAFDFDLVELPKGVQWIQIDLERSYQICAIVVWHDIAPCLPIVQSVVVQVADDADFTSNVRTLFNNDYENRAGLGRGDDKQYFEGHEGKLIDAKGVKARVIRLYSNGSLDTFHHGQTNPRNGYEEVEVWAIEPK